MVIRGVILGLNACFWHLEVHFDRYRVHHNILHDVPNVNVGRSNRLTRFFLNEHRPRPMPGAVFVFGEVCIEMRILLE